MKRQVHTYFVCGAYAVHIFSAPMLTDQSVHTALQEQSFTHQSYLCCAARAKLKWQYIVRDKKFTWIDTEM